MQEIELNQKHKVKLLEMCKALFPEYKVKFILDSLLNYDDRIFNYLSIEEITEGEVDFTVIHWFEFSLTHLAEKIIATYITTDKGVRVYKRTLNDDLSNFYIKALSFSRGFEKVHPVDYLYEKFKKIK